jgi:hypothetical protein
MSLLGTIFSHFINALEDAFEALGQGAKAAFLEEIKELDEKLHKWLEEKSDPANDVRNIP